MEQRVEIQEHTEEQVCPHCWGSGWVMLTAENDFGEMEDYFVLCRRCGEAR